jgi:hypothetical protein
MVMRGASATDYRILVSRAERRPTGELYGFTLRDMIPSFPLPLKGRSELVMVNLQEIVMGVENRAGYAIRIDYQHPVPLPKLSAEDQAWV